MNVNIMMFDYMGILLDKDKDLIIRRAIHTSADFDYAHTLCFSEDAVRIARNLIREGADIVTDTNMALTGTVPFHKLLQL